MRILFTGGGSGGHFTPIIAVIRELKKIAETERILDLQLFYMGPVNFGKDDLKSEDILSYRISCGKIRRDGSLISKFKNLIDIFKIIVGIIQAAWRLFIIMPDVIFSKGGYGSFPALFIARLYRIPVIIHESDAVPGVVNRWSAKFAVRVGIAFDSAASFFPGEKVALVGNPVRTRILGGDIQESRDDFLVLSPDPVVLFLGGSQGAEKINNTVADILLELVKKYEVIHQTGKNNFEGVKLETKTILEHDKARKYHVFPFFNEDKLREAYAAADLVVARAGAATIFEIAAVGKPSILIPLKNAAQNHQRENAYEYARKGGAVVVEEDNLSPHILLNEIERLFVHPEIRKVMVEKAQQFSRIDAAEILAREILKIGLHV